jgi:hypothetical protein
MQESDDRNIDNDILLLNSVKNFYTNNHTEKALRWNLKQHGYSIEEIDRAISDYYWIYIRTPMLVNFILMPVCFLCVLGWIIFVCLIK